MRNTSYTPPLHPLFDDSLGIHGKLYVMPVGHDLQENGTFSKIEYASRRIERFALQEMARSILREMVERNGKMTYVHQVRNCLRAKITKKKGVTLFYNVERESKRTSATCKGAIPFGIVLFVV